MNNDERQLWTKIESFKFDKPNVSFTYAKRLAKENCISLDFANEIIEEYRKFIFLCCVSETPVSPSHWVDQAWHLHLTYTKSYWIDLCKNTLGRDIHHNPTEGGAAEDAKFNGLFRDTLELYERYFLSKRPAHVWAKEIPPPKKGVPSTDKSSIWIIPKPRFSFIRKKSSYLAVSAVVFAVAIGCGARSSSALPAILIFGGAVIIISYLIGKFRRSSGRGGTGSTSGCGSGCGSLGLFDSSDSDTSDHDGGCSGDSGSGDSGASGGGESGCSSGSSCSSGCGGGGCGGGD